MTPEPPRGYVAVPGSERRLPEGARRVGSVAPNERVEATILLRPAATAADAARPETIGAQPPRERSHRSREQVAEAFAADPDDLARVTQFASSAGLDVVAGTRNGERSTSPAALPRLAAPSQSS